jgi:alpha-mannosidase
MVNFKASQGGEIPLRYRLTTHSGPCDDLAAARFGVEAATPALVLRDYIRTSAASGSWLSVPEDAGILLTAKPAENGDGLILRLQSLRDQAEEIPVRAALSPASACLTSPLEEDDAPLPIEGTTIRVPVGARAIQSVRVRFMG